MKIDKRLSEEFGMDLPPPTPWWMSWRPRSVDHVVEATLASIVPFTVYAVMLTTGAFVEWYIPSIFWWFFGASVLALLCLTGLFVIVLVAATADDPMSDDGNYPGS